MATSQSDTKWFKKGSKLPDGTVAKKSLVWNTKTGKRQTGAVKIVTSSGGVQAGTKVTYKGGRRSDGPSAAGGGRRPSSKPTVRAKTTYHDHETSPTKTPPTKTPPTKPSVRKVTVSRGQSASGSRYAAAAKAGPKATPPVAKPNISKIAGAMGQTTSQLAAANTGSRSLPKTGGLSDQGGKQEYVNGKWVAAGTAKPQPTVRVDTTAKKAARAAASSGWSGVTVARPAGKTAAQKAADAKSAAADLAKRKAAAKAQAARNAK